jgi:hypothetical protein
MPDLQIPTEEHYREAIDSVRKRVPVPRKVWNDMQAEEREHAFTVSQVARVDVLQDVLDSIDKAVETGTAIGDFRAEVADKLIEQWGRAEIPGRIETIFRTNIQVAYAEGRHAINSAPAVKEARPFWRYDDTDNDRECEVCHDFHGMVRPADDPVWQRAHPPMHHKCILGESLVVAHDVLAVFKRWYDGNVVVIGTASGKRLSCTPNHPILTQDGYIAAGLLHVGGHVISHRHVEGMLLGDLNHQDVPTRIEEIVEAFAATGEVGSAEVPVSTEDFHGDGEGSKVAVVWTDRLLLNAGDPTLGQHGASGDLDGTRAPGALLAREGHPDPNFHGLLASPDRPVSRVCACKPLVTAELAHGEGVRLGSPTDENSRAKKDSTDGRPANVEIPRDQDLGGSRCVFSDDIVSVECQLFHGFVYNLQTASGHYTASGIVVHNCECSVDALSPEEAEEEGVTSAEDVPDTEADEGFGNEPSSEGKDWAPDLTDLDPDLRAALEEKLAGR